MHGVGEARGAPRWLASVLLAYVCRDKVRQLVPQKLMAMSPPVIHQDFQAARGQLEATVDHGIHCKPGAETTAFIAQEVGGQRT